MSYRCPKCNQTFEGKPNFCPTCGAKLNWGAQPQQAPAQPQQPVRPAPQPRPQHRYNPDDAPIASRPVRRKKKKIYALVVKILMMSFSGATLLFSFIAVLCFLGDFVKQGSFGLSGFKLAFAFDGTPKGAVKMPNAGGWAGPFVAFLLVLGVMGMSIMHLIKDIFFLHAKEYTVRVAKRRKLAPLYLATICGCALVAGILVLCTKPITGYGKYSIDLGGGAVAVFVFMLFSIFLCVAEEVLVLVLLRLAPKEVEYEEEEFEEYPEEV